MRRLVLAAGIATLAITVAPVHAQQESQVTEAIRLAANTYGVSETEMRRVAWCESRMNPNARNRSSGAAGLFQWLPSSWRAQGIPGFSVFNPYANAMAAARAVRRDGGWKQWECRP